MEVTPKTQPCSCCHTENTTYDPQDMCNRCQRRVASALGRISMLDRARAGYKRMTDASGNFCGYMRTAYLHSQAS